MEILKVSLPLQSLKAMDKGTTIVGADKDFGLTIIEQGSPLGKYKDSEANFNSLLNMEFYTSLEDVQETVPGYFKRFLTVTGLNTHPVNDKELVYSVELVSESTENDFFKETFTITTNDKKLANKFKYGQFVMAFGGIVNA